MNAKRNSSVVNRADLLWAIALVRSKPYSSVPMSNEDKQYLQYATMAKLLGFEVVAPVDEVVIQTLPTQDSPLVDSDAFKVAMTAVNEVGVTATASLQSTATNSAYYRVVSRQREQPQTDAEHQAHDLPPDWFSQASPTILQEITSRIPKVHQVKPLHTPLIPWARLLPLLQRLLGQQIRGMQADIPKLVRQVADKAFVQQIPRKQRYGWAYQARVLIDINEQNFPYRRDFIHLREQLKQTRGSDGLEIQYLLDEPGGHIARYANGQEVIEAWQFPAKDTPLLILSDMGMQAGSRRVLLSWLVFGQLFKAQGMRPTVLMPVAERQIDQRLLKYFDCIVWDRNSSLKRVKGLYQAEHDSQDHTEIIEQLLCYCFATVRVDCGLLRAIRDLLSVRFDIGHESSAWQHAAIQHAGDEWAWQDSMKPQYLPQAWQQLVRLPHAKQEKLVELIGRYHALYPDELYFEAMYTLMMLGLPVPAEVRIATDKFLLDTLATYRLHPEDTLLDGWVKRYLARYEASAMRKEHRYWLAFKSYERKHEANRQGTAEIDMPADLTAAEQAKVLGYVNEFQAEQSYVLRQIGEHLELLPAHAVLRASQEDEWGRFANVGMHLLKLNLQDMRIFHEHHDSQGKKHLVLLDLAKTGEGFAFPPTGQHKLQIGGERIGLEVKTAQQQREPWMKRITAGSQGLCAGSLTGGDYYWHPPEWNHERGMMRGFWHYLPPDTVDFKPGWANAGGRDQYGVYADVDIAGVTQRFRWIEPGTFMMGSPEDESERNDDELLHEVSLTQGFWFANTVVTQELWLAIMGVNPSHFAGKNKPLEHISWLETQNFIDNINQLNPELSFTLPSEAQWEYACRAGTRTRFSFGSELNKDDANFAASMTVAVASYMPNDWGIYDMHGNVWEYCHDWYEDYPMYPTVDPIGQKGNRRVLRGGSWRHSARLCRAAYRDYGDSAALDYSCGLRLTKRI